MRSMKRKLKTVLFYLTLTVVVFLINLPIINMVGSSMKNKQELFTNNHLFPYKPTVENFANVLERTPFFRYVVNSLLVAVVVAVSVMVISCLAGYAISRYSKRIKLFRYYSNLFLILQMFPGVLLMIPLVLVFSKAGLADSLGGLILIYISSNIPFCTWMISGFFDGIPIEMEEAAQIDGCNAIQCFLRLVLPLSSPGIASIVIFTFINSWNEYMMANVILKNQNLRTLPLGLQTFIMQFDTDWGSLMAASTMTIIPVVFFLVFMQKHIVSGLTAGAVKG
ncbi:MAG: carbohydrate ABC transporter permease [Hungatella hathewayi]|nr:carbohydrate ABC transporter permease [Hungatella hathewayi]